MVEALPYPTVVIIFEECDGSRSAEIHGPRTGRLTRSLAGRGRSFGITFRPGAFAPFLEGKELSGRRGVAAITDRRIPVDDLFGKAGVAWAAAVHAEADSAAQIARATEFLAPLLVPLPAAAARVRDLVEQMANDHSLMRVDDLCRASGLDLRTLQRGFRQRVGLSAKWVLQRFRLHEAVERLKAPDRPTLAALAAALDYADQSHFSRDFKQVVGITPRQFIDREA